MREVMERGGAAVEARNVQIVRILNMLTALSEGGRALTARELIEEYYPDSGRRTFFRDLDAVREAGVQVERKRLPGSREMTYRIPHSPVYARLRFAEEELFSLCFARGMLRGLEGTPFWKGIDSALDKIMRLLPEELQQYCVLAESYFVSRSPRSVPYEAHAGTISALTRAMIQDRACEIQYQKPGSAEIDRHVMHPYYVAYVDGLLYLRGFSELRGEQRTLRLDRIRAIKPLERKFERPEEYRHENLDAESLFSGSFQIIEAPDREEVSLEFSPSSGRFVRERRWHPSQQVEELPGGKVRLRMLVPLSVELTQWILSYGEEVRVLEPRDLRKEVGRRLGEAARRYRR